MKLRSVWVVVVASTMLAMSTQTDLAFASLFSVVSNSSPQSISSGSWSAVAGVDSNVTNADRAGNTYSMTLTSSCSTASAITRVSTGSWASGTIITLTTPWTGLQKGYLVTGSGIFNSYSIGSPPSSSTARIKNLLPGNKIELDSGGNTGTGTLTFTISKEVDNVSDFASGGSSNDGRIIKVKDSDITDLTVGMTITGDIASSGTNTIISIPASPTRTFITATGTNTDNNQYLAFTPAQVCTSTSSYFTVKNTGDIAINSMSITQSGTSLSSGNTTTWTTCSGLSDEAAETCSVAPTTILTATSASGAQQLNVPLAPNAWIRVRAVSSAAGAGLTLSVSVSVATSDLRTGINTNQ